MSGHEKNFAPHAGDGWAQTTTGQDKPCPRCGARILPGDLVVASGYSESPILWICARHSNIEADRPVDAAEPER
jgi:hypothetical protein